MVESTKKEEQEKDKSSVLGKRTHKEFEETNKEEIKEAKVDGDKKE